MNIEKVVEILKKKNWDCERGDKPTETKKKAIIFKFDVNRIFSWKRETMIYEEVKQSQLFDEITLKELGRKKKVLVRPTTIVLGRKRN